MYISTEAVAQYKVHCISRHILPWTMKRVGGHRHRGSYCHVGALNIRHRHVLGIPDKIRWCSLRKPNVHGIMPADTPKPDRFGLGPLKWYVLHSSTINRGKDFFSRMCVDYANCFTHIELVGCIPDGLRDNAGYSLGNGTLSVHWHGFEL